MGRLAAAGSPPERLYCAGRICPRALECGIALGGVVAVADVCGGAPASHEQRDIVNTWSATDAATHVECDAGWDDWECGPGSAGAGGQHATGGQSGNGGGEAGGAGSAAGSGGAGSGG